MPVAAVAAAAVDRVSQNAVDVVFDGNLGAVVERANVANGVLGVVVAAATVAFVASGGDQDGPAALFA